MVPASYTYPLQTVPDPYVNYMNSTALEKEIWQRSAEQRLKSCLSLRMYCIDTGAIAFTFNGGSSCASTIRPIDLRKMIQTS